MFFRRVAVFSALTILALPALVTSPAGPVAATAKTAPAAGATASAAGLHVEISGRFRDFTTGQAIGGAVVTVVKQDGTVAGTAVADAAGDFDLSVETLAGGGFTAVYKAAGYLQEESLVTAPEPRLTLSPLLTPQGVKEAVLFSLPRTPAGSLSGTGSSLAGLVPVSALTAVPSGSTPIAAAAALSPPATIRVYRTSLGIVQVVDFKFYCKHVLPSEWLVGWPVDSLRAGAVAVKEYAWYYVSKGGKWPSLGADVQDGVNDQWYDPARSDPRTDAAVDYTWSNYMLKNGALFAVQFCGDTTLDSNYRCTIHPTRMPQWGTYHMALDLGRDWTQILHHYWDPVSLLPTIPGGPTRFEETDPHIVYTPAIAWQPFSTTGASSSTYARSSTGGSYVTISFNGTYLAWIATAGTTLSKADVSLDGGDPVTIDLARSAVAYQQDVWDTGTLPSGVHTVRISRNANDAAGKFISIDAVDVTGTLITLAPPTITSLSVKNGTTAGGTAVVITGANFTGATDVTFGGTAAASFTVNSATQITATAPAHTNGSGRVVVTTAVGSNADTTADDFAFTTRSEQGAAGIVYTPASGAWGPFNMAGASGGSYTRSSANGSYVTITFTGTYVAWIATTGTTVSMADVSVDGGAVTIVDLARAATAYQRNVWNTGTLTAGTHKVKIMYHLGNATGKFIDLDAVEVAGTLN